MSIFGIKDLDYKFAEYLDNKSLFSFKSVNKYYLNLFNSDEFWRKRFYSNYVYEFIKIKDKFINRLKENWEKYYRLTDYLLEQKENLSICNCIEKDLPDLLILIMKKNNVKFDTLFNSGKYYDKNAVNIVSSSSNRFTPMNLIIRKDSINCFKNLFNLDQHRSYYYLEMSMINKSNKIVKYMIYKNIVKIDIRVLKIALMYRYQIPKLFENTNLL